MSLSKLASLVTAALFVLGGCTAEPQEAPLQTPPNSESMRDPAGSSAPTSSGTGPDAAKNSANAQNPVLAVEGGGIRFFNPVTSSATPIPFGRPQSKVLAALERVRGPAGRGTNESCGAGPVHYANWPDGLSLVFQNDRFAGWSLDGRAAGALSTAGSIGPGSTREDLDGTYGNVEVRQTSLGDEFSAGGFFGLLNGPNATSRITHMWAGVNCVAR